jgi:hypothetical protein
MPIRIERSVDDPIVTFIFEGALDQDAVQDAKMQTAQLLTEMGLLYAVIDLRNTATTEEQAAALFSGPDIPALSSDGHGRLRFVFVKTQLANAPASQRSEPSFSTREEATDYILKDIAGHAPGDVNKS